MRASMSWATADWLPRLLSEAKPCVTKLVEDLNRDAAGPSKQESDQALSA